MNSDGDGAIRASGANSHMNIGRALLLGGVLSSLLSVNAPRIAANLPTPWVGVWERINIGAFLLWVVVLAVALWRELSSRDRWRDRATPAPALHEPVFHHAMCAAGPPKATVPSIRKKNRASSLGTTTVSFSTPDARRSLTLTSSNECQPGAHRPCRSQTLSDIACPQVVGQASSELRCVGAGRVVPS